MPHYARPMEIHSRRVDRSCRKARLQTAVQRLTHLIIITKAWLQKCSHAFLLHKAQPTAEIIFLVFYNRSSAVDYYSTAAPR